jgi:hypothetical protein
MSTPYGLGALPSPIDYRDFPLAALYEARGIEPAAAIPAVYVAPGDLPPVLNQGSSPQCVAYSSASLKSYEDRIDQATWFDFDQPTFFGRIGGGPDGAYLRDAMAQLLKVGYPVRGIDDAAHHKIVAYYAVPLSQADIQTAILAFGPLVVAMSWDNAWFTPRSDGTLPPPRGTSAGGHAIAAIGWDARGLRLRNSWGSSWGQSGDCYLPWAYLGRVWEAWKAVDQIITPPPEATMQFLPRPVRVFDGSLPAKVNQRLPIAGQYGIPAAAIGVAAILRVVRPSAGGWVYAGPDPGAVPNISTLDYAAGQITDGFPTALLTAGNLTVYPTSALTRFVVDVVGYFTA